MANHSIIRVTREINGIQRSNDLSLAVACRDADVRNVRALIVGPPDSPYEFGFFEFSVKFGKDYPGKAPYVLALTTNGGRCRFNPNIYAGGKVCLSILGTWRGERGEEWSSAQGLESILLSIQSLMSSNPYENEPGYEDANGPEDKKNQKDYVMKIRHESLRISVIQRLESYLAIGTSGTVAPESSSSEESEREEMDGEAYDNAPYEPFKDLCKRRFMWYYDSYLLAINGAKRDVQDGQPFARMPFEGGGNDMVGKFNYTELERRLVRIKSALDAEIAGWAKEGFESKRKDTGVAANLQRQHEQVVEHFKKSSHSTSVEMVDGNPFLWEITYFGRPMSQLDGGMFRFKLCMSPRFPEEQPRAKFETKMFHHRIAADGTPCYTTDKPEDMRSHMDAIISALEEEHPPYDPRTTVNPEASKLYWGSKEDKKKYNRQLRRAVERSAELD